MTIFRPEDCATAPRADMFLPKWILAFGVCLGVMAIACLTVACVTQAWLWLAGFAVAGVFGLAAWLCWKNQSVVILDEERFSYTSFLGKTTVYVFSQIKDLRVNADSLTLFVGDGKVHIEACACISQRLIDKIDEALAKDAQPL